MSQEMSQSGLVKGEDGGWRCAWSGHLPDYQAYHDHEWGVPVDDDIRLFEKICLEGFQSGLSWLTILRKRETFRSAFAGFDFEKIADFDDADVNRLLGDPGIVRHRGKINATINNARAALPLRKEYGTLAAYFWSFVPPASERPQKCDWASLRQLGQTPTSQRLSKDLKKRGWRFVGPTTAYAFMQAMGLVNDHVEGCFCRDEVDAVRAAFNKP